jgi:NDP-sugar pyrophosphorylase family protein
MAGGKGTRLAPYTISFPKPLMPIGDMPILELLIRQLRRDGVRRIVLAVGHLASLLMAYFGDGSKFGVSIEYALEPEPLGTAGPLSLVAGLNDTFLVMNGDLLTDLDFSKLSAAHRKSGSMATVGLYRRSVQVDLGVVEMNPDATIARYIEKPVHEYLVSMGVYVLEPQALKRIPSGQRFDLPDLINAMLKEGVRVTGYEHAGYWLDIGRPEDYRTAQQDFEVMRGVLLDEDEDRRSPASSDAPEHP